MQLQNTLTFRMLSLLVGTRIEAIAKLLMWFIHKGWNKKPILIVRLCDFLPIGGMSTILQLMLFILLDSILGWLTLESTIIAVLGSALFNFWANQKYTWRERFEGLTFTKQQRVKSFLLLYVAFVVTMPTVWIKILGISILAALGIPVYLSWFFLEGVGTIANYLLVDYLSFGHLGRKIAKHYSI